MVQTLDRPLPVGPAKPGTAWQPPGKRVAARQATSRLPAHVQGKRQAPQPPSAPDNDRSAALPGSCSGRPPLPPPHASRHTAPGIGHIARGAPVPPRALPSSLRRAGPATPSLMSRSAEQPAARPAQPPAKPPRLPSALAQAAQRTQTLQAQARPAGPAERKAARGAPRAAASAGLLQGQAIHTAEDTVLRTLNALRARDGQPGYASIDEIACLPPRFERIALAAVNRADRVRFASPLDERSLALALEAALARLEAIDTLRRLGVNRAPRDARADSMVVRTRRGHRVDVPFGPSHGGPSQPVTGARLDALARRVIGAYQHLRSMGCDAGRQRPALAVPAAPRGVRDYVQGMPGVQLLYRGEPLAAREQRAAARSVPLARAVHAVTRDAALADEPSAAPDEDRQIAAVIELGRGVTLGVPRRETARAEPNEHMDPAQPAWAASMRPCAQVMSEQPAPVPGEPVAVEPGAALLAAPSPQAGTTAGIEARRRYFFGPMPVIQEEDVPALLQLERDAGASAQARIAAAGSGRPRASASNGAPPCASVAQRPQKQCRARWHVPAMMAPPPSLDDSSSSSEFASDSDPEPAPDSEPAFAPLPWRMPITAWWAAAKSIADTRSADASEPGTADEVTEEALKRAVLQQTPLPTRPELPRATRHQVAPDTAAAPAASRLPSRAASTPVANETTAGVSRTPAPNTTPFAQARSRRKRSPILTRVVTHLPGWCMPRSRRGQYSFDKSRAAWDRGDAMHARPRSAQWAKAF